MSIIELPRLLERARTGDLTLIGWGAGELCRRTLPLAGLSVAALVDRNDRLWGEELCGVRIHPPSLLDQSDPATTAIVIFSEALEAIRRSVLEHGDFRTIPVLSAMSLIPPEAAVLYGGATLPRRDYVSPGLEVVVPDACFPNRVEGDPRSVSWEFLRAHHPHAWYCDRRFPTVGLLNRDEAAILYNSAKLFAGKRGLEVGAWIGWSACHVALAGVELDVVDPSFGHWWLNETVESALTAAGVRERVRLHTGYSPDAVARLARTRAPWSFLFIDGDHDGAAPRLDAEECRHHAADDALVLFHDLASPFVAAGLDALADAGWQTMVYDTAQIMGVAWRGNVEPVSHQPDPAARLPLPPHLARYRVSG